MSYKIFVRHVPKNASKEYIQEAFEKEFGEVEDIAIPTDPYTFKPRGFIYVTFTHQESMEAALRKGTCSVMGSTVEISTVETKKKGKQCQRLFIKGLPTDSNEKDLLAFFESKGNVVLKIFPRDRNNGLLRNFCYITYDSEPLTNQLLQDGYMMMDDIRLTVTAAQRRDQLYPDSYERPKATDKIDELVNPDQQEYDPTMYSGPAAATYNYQYPPQDPYGYNYGQYDPNYQYPSSQQGQYYDPNYQYPPQNGGYGQYDANYQYPPQDGGYGQYDPNYQYPPYPESSNSAYTTPSEMNKHAGADNEKPADSTVPNTENAKPSDSYAYPSGDAPTSDPYKQPSQDPYSYNPQEAYQEAPSTDPYKQPPPAGSPYQQPPPADPYKQPPPAGSPYQQPPPADPYQLPPPAGNPYQQPPPADPYKQPPPAGSPYQQPPPADPYQLPPPAGNPYQQPPPADPYKQPPPAGSPYQQPPPAGNPYQQPPYNTYQQPPVYPPQGEWDRRGPHGGWDRREPPRERDHRRPSGWDRRDPQRGWDRRDPQSGWDNRQRERSRSRNRDSGSYRHDQGEDLTRIFIQGLIPTITEQDLKDHFSPYGRVVHVSLPINHETGKQRDLAFVTMENPESVDRILREASRTIKGYSVKQICRAKSKPSRR